MSQKKNRVTISGEPTVLVEGQPAASQGNVPPDGKIPSGEPTVLVGGRPAVTLGKTGTSGRPSILLKGRPAMGMGDQKK